MNPIESSAGLIMEGDVLSLSESLCIESDKLIDKANNARHSLHPKAVEVIKYLEKGTSAQKWEGFMNSIILSKDQKFEIITFLNAIGAIKIKRSLFSSIRRYYVLINLRLSGFRMISTARRRSSNIIGLNLLILTAMTPIIVLVFLAGLLEFGAGLDNAQYLFGNAIFIVCLWLSTVAHEYVHIFLSRTDYFEPVLLQKGLRIGVLHQPLSISRSIASALGGPVAGALVALVFAVVIVLTTNQLIPIFFAISVAVFHLLSWLPTYGDGQAIVKNIRRYNASAS